MAKRGITPEKARDIRSKRGLEETNLQKIRIARGLSQKTLSVKSNVKVRAIKMYEQRERNIDGAHLKTLCDLSISLDCKIEDILEDKTLIERFKLCK